MKKEQRIGKDEKITTIHKNNSCNEFDNVSEDGVAV